MDGKDMIGLTYERQNVIYYEGYNSTIAGGSIMDNPYDSHTNAAGDWIQGHLDAKRELNQ